MMSNFVIVGAGRGIGLELVRKIIAENNKVVVLTRNGSKLPKDDRLLFIPFDLEYPEDPEDLIIQIQAFLGNVDALVNNAGYLVNKPFSEITTNDLQRSYQVNVMGVFQVIQRLLELISKNSHIVNISSMGGVQGSAKFPGLSAYSPSKAALCGLTEILAEELKELNISVNCLALGAVQTEMLEEAFPGYKAPVSPEGMAGYIYEFTSTGHHFFNGKVLPVANSTP